MKYYETGGTVTTPTDPTVGTAAGGESSLSTWAGDYVTDMLGKGQALSNMGYQGYEGQMVAGTSDLQNQAFSGVAGLAVPQNMGTFTPQTFTADTAQQYMNPYLEASLNPQIEEARRQAEIQRLQSNKALTQAGAFGGSRQAIMDAEANRNLLSNISNITGQGYASAYDKAMQQFNTEQGRMQTAQDAANTYGIQTLGAQADMGALQRDIEQQALTADVAQFKEERDFPYKQVQYQQSLLQGLPISAQAYSYNTPSSASDFLSGVGGIMEILKSAGYDLGGSSTPTTTDGEST